MARPYPHNKRPEQLFWYLGKRFYQAEDQSDPDPGNWVQELIAPGTGDPVTRVRLPGLTSASYDEGAGTCLIGTRNKLDPVPADWTELTKGQAQAEWNTIHGRAAKPEEVW